VNAAPHLIDRATLTVGGRQMRLAWLLLPERDRVDGHRRDRRALHNLDQPHVGIVCEQQAEQQGTDDHADEQHDEQQRHHFGPHLRGCEITSEREPGRLDHMQTGTNQQECKPRRNRADPCRAGGVAGQNDQRHRHDREAAVLHHRAEPEIRHPSPAEE
jgi:hypothetical protein